MSLLRDALKKAERAQEEAHPQASPQHFALEPEFESVALESHAEPPLAAEPAPQEILASAPEAAVAPAAMARTTTIPEWEPNPRLPFYLAVCALSLVGAGGAIHLWLQLRPPSSIAQSAPARPANSRAESISAKPQAAEPLLATTQEALASLATPPAVPSIEEPNAKATDIRPPEPAPRPIATPRAAETEAIVIPRPFQRATEPAHGLKTIPDEAPASGAAHSLLGSEHARTGRWSDAQYEYAQAVVSDPENPDFVFNLAVSLDRLQQKREAVLHYELALRLRQGRHSSFPADAARERMRYLAR